MTDETKIEVKPTCNLCGEPMPNGEEMFMYHGYSGPCPKPPLPKPPAPPQQEPAAKVELPAFALVDYSLWDEVDVQDNYLKQRETQLLAALTRIAELEAELAVTRRALEMAAERAGLSPWTQPGFWLSEARSERSGK